MPLGARSAFACVAACVLLGLLAGGAQAAGSHALEFDWSMPESYGHALDANGLPAPTEPRSVPTFPDKVEFTIKDCDPKGDYRISAQGVTLKVVGRVGCTYTVNGFPRFSTYRVRISVEQHGLLVEREEEVELNQWLIVSLGDSVASGEGVPERVLPVLRARWQDEQCHRSEYAGPAVAARTLAERNPRVQVTFVHLACSGATIEKGLLKPYKGIAGPLFRPSLSPQVDELEDLPQSPTAVLVSIGANDVNFSGLTKLCLFRHVLRLGCFAGKRLKTHLAELPTWYGKLADALVATKKVQPSRVFLTEYFDPTHDENGVPCGQLETVGRVKILGRRDVEAAYDNLLEPLNVKIAAAVELYGWHEVTGVADAFRTHGICARDTWITSFKASLFKEGDGFLGTLHPNRDGQQAISTLIEPAIARAGLESSCPAQAAGRVVEAAYETGVLQLTAPAPAAACIRPVVLGVGVVAVPNRRNSLGAALWVLITLAILAAALLALAALNVPAGVRALAPRLATILLGAGLVAFGVDLIHHAAPATALMGVGALALLLALLPLPWAARGRRALAPSSRRRPALRGTFTTSMDSKGWTTTNLAVVGLGASLVVFFAGATAALAAGATVPTALWAAGTAVSGGLIGLLVPPPGSAKAHERAAKLAQKRQTEALKEAAEHTEKATAPGGSEAAVHTALAEAATATAKTAKQEVSAHAEAAGTTTDTKIPAIALAVVFVLAVALATVLAVGTFVPPASLTESLKGLITVVVAIASGSGSALIGIFTPSSGSAKTGS
jgi:lysophospholipase L1-like esterase